MDLENAGKSFRATSSQGSPDKDSSSSSAAVSPLLSSSSSTPHVRDEWERYGARYFRGVVKMKRELKKESDVEMLVEVRTLCHPSGTYCGAFAIHVNPCNVPVCYGFHHAVEKL